MCDSKKNCKKFKIQKMDSQVLLSERVEGVIVISEKHHHHDPTHSFEILKKYGLGALCATTNQAPLLQLSLPPPIFSLSPPRIQNFLAIQFFFLSSLSIRRHSSLPSQFQKGTKHNKNSHQSATGNNIAFVVWLALFVLFDN